MENIGRPEYEEFARRMDEENHRQNKRIESLEENVKQINQLTLAVEKMAVNMENMLGVLENQGKRLGELEKVPLETNRQVKSAVITALVSAVVGAVMSALFVMMQYGGAF
jgi:integral membrane sensor domain MASE1